MVINIIVEEEGTHGEESVAGKLTPLLTCPLVNYATSMATMYWNVGTGLMKVFIMLITSLRYKSQLAMIHLVLKSSKLKKQPT